MSLAEVVVLMFLRRQAVANKFLSDIKLEDEEVRAKLVTMCQRFHTDASRLGDSFRSTLGRVVYVTPTSYLELILIFKDCLAVKREQVSLATKRYQNGLAQVAMATRSVNEMQDELTLKQPVLQKAQVRELK
jgi:dynein heavy chain